jgi:hypothetical protein
MTLDLSVYTRPRMWRVINSRHGTSGLYKVELFHDELRNATPEEIRALARAPREPLYDPCEYQDIEPIDIAAGWWRLRWQEYLDSQTLATHEPTPIQAEVKATVVEGRLPQDLSGHPRCMQELLAWRTAPTDEFGKRQGNRAMMHLATYLKDVGVGIDEAIGATTRWAHQLENVATAGNPQAAADSAKGVVGAVYRGDDYRFRCGVGRRLGLPCEEEACTAVVFQPKQWSRCLGPNPDWQEPRTLSLDEARTEVEHWTKTIMEAVSVG